LRAVMRRLLRLTTAVSPMLLFFEEVERHPGPEGCRSIAPVRKESNLVLI
jgi:hypothetical protein